MYSEHCCEKVSHSQVACADPGSTKAVFLNPTRTDHYRIKLDGCELPGDCCDWLLHKEGVGRLLIELKGSDVHHACAQIMKGVSWIISRGLTELPAGGLIVSKNCSTMASTTLQRAKRDLMKRNFRLAQTKQTNDLRFEEFVYGHRIC